ncbi:hypothetical protein [Lentzea tibetensis]|nr:hypothetical protein [Lentzea tibetensis]
MRFHLIAAAVAMKLALVAGTTIPAEPVHNRVVGATWQGWSTYRF